VFRQKDPVYRKILSETRDGRISHESYNVLKPDSTQNTTALHNGCVPPKYSQPESTWITRTGDTTPNCVERRPCSSSPKDGRRDIRDHTFIPIKP
jgi:hypothetical protein